jgi:hypothetical protein
VNPHVNAPYEDEGFFNLERMSGLISTQTPGWRGSHDATVFLHPWALFGPQILKL